MLSDWYRLLPGMPGIEGEVVRRDLAWHPFLGPGGMILILVLLLASTIWLYRERGSDLSPRRKVLLFFLRTGALLALFPMLVQLQVRLESRERVRPVIAVAVDTSASMDLEDRYVTPEQTAAVARSLGLASPAAADALLEAGRLARIDLVRAMVSSPGVGFATGLADGARPAWFRFGAGADPLAPEGWEAAPAAAVAAVRAATSFAERTALADAVDEILAALRGQPVASVILLADGAGNAGPSPVAAAEAWRDRGVKVYPVVVGDASPADVEVVQLIADRLLFKGDTVNVLARLRSRGLAGRTVTVTLRQAEQEIATTKVTLDPTQSEMTVPLAFTPDRIGEYTCQVEVPVQPEEIVEDNNRMSFTARVTDEGIKVLYVENLPRWQYRFLRNAMHRDRRVDLSVVLVSGERAPEPEPPELTGLPASKEDLFRYDLIILGDVSPGIFTAEQLDSMRELVAEKGAGFLALAGPFHNPWDYADTVIGDLFPVDVEVTGEERRRWPERSREDLFRVELSPEGLAHPVMSLAEEWEANAPAWDTLSSLYWYAPVRKPRPGATVLAVHPRERSQDQPVPIFAFQYYGRGACFYAGVDETWRWRLKQGDRVFYRFWGQVVQFLGTAHLEGKERRLEVRTDKPRYERGETALVTVRGEEISLAPDHVYFGVAEDQSGRETRFPLSRSAASGNLLEGRLPLTTPGLCSIWLEGHELVATAVIDVKPPRLEFQNPAANPELMEQVARITGGRMFRAEEFPELLEVVERDPVTLLRKRELSLWDRPLWLLLLCVALAGEWALRRLWQLP